MSSLFLSKPLFEVFLDYSGCAIVYRLPKAILEMEPRHLCRGALHGVAIEPRRVQNADRSGQRTGDVAYRDTNPAFTNVEASHSSHVE